MGTPRKQSLVHLGLGRTACLGVIVPVALFLFGASAHAAEGELERSAPNLPGADEEVPDDRIERLEERIQELSDRLRQAEDAQREREASPLSINGYVDFGFFSSIDLLNGGNRNSGVGFVEDFGNLVFPQFGPMGATPYTWTFYGDILSTSVNSRGDVADLGDSPGIERFDSINSDGAPGFIANEINLRLGYALSERAIARSSVNFVPRSGRDFALGDYIDVDVAELEYVLTRDGNTSLFVGKSLPVFGIEYKERKSDQRFGITPSLIHRYTSGSQLGVKLRSKLLDGWLVFSGSATNNSSGTEQFHFYSEIDKNANKILNGRLAVSVPIGKLARTGMLAGHRAELGFSEEYGAQDWASDTGGKIQFHGVDFQYLATSFAIKAQWIRGSAPGRADGSAWKLDLKDSGYVELDWQILPQFGFMLRWEQRDAFVALAMERAYITQSRRYTVGARVVFNPHMVAKVEYLVNREYGDVPEFDNDILTTSLVLAY